MVIDTSALLAILLNEAEAEDFALALTKDPRRLLSAFSALESSVLIEARKGDAGGRELDLLLHRAQVETVPLNEQQVTLARQAWRKYERGRHPARLNVGDCCAYALSRYAEEPLLYKGNDFSQTDVAAVL